MKAKINGFLKISIALCFITVIVMNANRNVIAEVPFWTEDFQAFDPNKYHLQGDGYWDEGNGYFVLTEPERAQTGRIFFNTPSCNL
jgi:hypothetical protein